MCGRYQFFDDENPDIAALIEQLRGHMDPAEFAQLSLFEVFPGQRVPAYVYDRQNSSFRLVTMDWGLPGHNGSLLINARSETVREKNTFRNMQICLIPACGYYEWAKDPRQKYYFSIPEPPVWLCGLYTKTAEGLRFVIVTEPATMPQAMIHDRQPVLLPKEKAAEACRRNDIDVARSASITLRTMRAV